MKYKEIIKEYNNGKDINATKKAFDDLADFLRNLSDEDSRAMREGLDEETLAIFDLLKKENLSLAKIIHTLLIHGKFSLFYICLTNMKNSCYVL